VTTPKQRTLQVLTQTELVPNGYGTSETLRPKVVLEQVLQGLEQAGDTILPRIVYAPTLRGALKCALQEWDHPDAPQQVRKLSDYTGAEGQCRNALSMHRD
jgi:hypothetical protein